MTKPSKEELKLLNHFFEYGFNNPEATYYISDAEYNLIEKAFKVFREVK